MVIAVYDVVKANGEEIGKSPETIRKGAPYKGNPSQRLPNPGKKEHPPFNG